MRASSLSVTGLAIAGLSIASANAAPANVTNIKSANTPWVGCSFSAGIHSSTCRNFANHKTYVGCMDAGLKAGWTRNEYQWYCGSLGLKQ